MSALRKPVLVPGMRVRCVYRDANGHVGTLLAIDDPRAWAHSLAFPEAGPPAHLVTAHVKRCQARGDLDGSRLPVLWDFGKLYWDSQLREASAPLTRGPIQTSRFGTLEIGAGGFEGPRRSDLWLGNDGTRIMERTFVTSGSDVSERFRQAYGDDAGHGRYDSRCSCCYLGFAHSVNVHERATREKATG